MPQDSFTFSIDKEILLTTSDTTEARKKIEELKKEQTPYFTFSNNTENLTFVYTKKDIGNGYWVARDIYIKQTNKP
jgi:hypothetical protein